MEIINISGGEAMNQLREDDCSYETQLQLIHYLVKTKKIRWRHLQYVFPLFLERDGWSRKQLFKYFQNIVSQYEFKLTNSIVIDIATLYPDFSYLFHERYVEPVEVDDFIREKMLEGRYNYSFYRENPHNLSFDVLKQVIERHINDYCIENGIKNVFKMYIPKKQFDVVVDGNNVILHNCGKVKKDSVNELTAIVNKLKDTHGSVLVYIHERHHKWEKYAKHPIWKNPNVCVIYTPYKYNDDWFSIYYAILNNIYIVSNDNYKDHILKYQTDGDRMSLKAFLAYRHIHTTNFVDLTYPRETIPIIYYRENAAYIPETTGGFIKIEPK